MCWILCLTKNILTEKYFGRIGMHWIKCEFTELQLSLHREQEFPSIYFLLNFI